MQSRTSHWDSITRFFWISMNIYNTHIGRVRTSALCDWNVNTVSFSSFFPNPAANSENSLFIDAHTKRFLIAFRCQKMAAKHLFLWHLTLWNNKTRNTEECKNTSKKHFADFSHHSDWTSVAFFFLHGIIHSIIFSHDGDTHSVYATLTHTLFEHQVPKNVRLLTNSWLIGLLFGHFCPS